MSGTLWTLYIDYLRKAFQQPREQLTCIVTIDTKETDVTEETGCPRLHRQLTEAAGLQGLRLYIPFFQRKALSGLSEFSWILDSPVWAKHLHCAVP